jgi:hypothetical protein
MLKMAGPTGGPKEAEPMRDTERSGAERRSGGDRRSGFDRRGPYGEMRDTPATFSPDEARAIKATVFSGREAPCPRCGGRLCFSPAVLLSGGGAIQEVRCMVCYRSVMLRRTP